MTKGDELKSCLENINGLIQFHEGCLKDLYTQRINIKLELSKAVEHNCENCASYDATLRSCFKDFPNAIPIYNSLIQGCDSWESVYYYADT